MWDTYIDAAPRILLYTSFLSPSTFLLFFNHKKNFAACNSAARQRRPIPQHEMRRRRYENNTTDWIYSEKNSLGQNFRRQTRNCMLF